MPKRATVSIGKECLSLDLCTNTMSRVTHPVSTRPTPASWALLAAIAWLICVATGFCGADSLPTPANECRWADGTITIDGKADEPAWAAAQVIENFTVP